MYYIVLWAINKNAVVPAGHTEVKHKNKWQWSSSIYMNEITLPVLGLETGVNAFREASPSPDAIPFHVY